MIRIGWTYDFRQIAGVLPRSAATNLTALVTVFLRAFSFGACEFAGQSPCQRTPHSEVLACSEIRETPNVVVHVARVDVDHSPASHNGTSSAGVRIRALKKIGHPRRGNVGTLLSDRSLSAEVKLYPVAFDGNVRLSQRRDTERVVFPLIAVTSNSEENVGYQQYYTRADSFLREVAPPKIVTESTAKTGRSLAAGVRGSVALAPVSPQHASGYRTACCRRASSQRRIGERG